MLSEEEKREMLEDAKSAARREHFRTAKKDLRPCTFDEYIEFLNSIQKIFGAFKISTTPTPTSFNRL